MTRLAGIAVVVLVLCAMADDAYSMTDVVIRKLGMAIMGSSGDCFKWNEERGRYETSRQIMSMDDLFSMQTLPGWGYDANEAAFTNFLMSMSREKPDVIPIHRQAIAAAMLRFSSVNGYTNVLGAVRNFILTHDRVCRVAAWQGYIRLVSPSLEENRFLDYVLGSSLVDDEVTFGKLCDSYLGRLMTCDCGANWTVLTNTLDVFGGYITNCVGAVEYDRLAARVYPAYNTSSNRLAFAMSALLDSDDVGLVVNYFAPITNRLMSIQGPLPEVEELRR